MPPRPNLLWPSLRFCGDCLAWIACWALWLTLGLLLAVQIGIALSSELAVPKRALRSLETRLSASGVVPHFGRATFDPGGRLLLENVRLSLPAYAEPVITARALYLELNPWHLLAGRIEVRGVHATGLTLFVPAMLAPSGRSEEILSDLEFLAEPGDNFVELRHLSARVASIAVTAEGGLQIKSPPSSSAGTALPLIQSLVGHFPDFSRQVIRLSSHVANLERPALHFSFTPSPSRGAIVHATLLADQASLPPPYSVSARGLRITARFPLLGSAPSIAPLVITAEQVQGRDGITLDGLHARLRGALRPSPFAYTPRDAEVTAGQLSARGFQARALSARLSPGALPRLEGELLADLAGGAVALTGQADTRERTARVHVTGDLSPALLDPIGASLGRDIRRYLDFGAPVALDADVVFAPGWKFASLTGRVAARQIDAYGVPMDAVQGDIAFDGRRFVATHARAQLGENFARGSFEQDLSTRAFRFLLAGRLRPLAIGGWFREWWPNFFHHFEFPLAPPDASVDVAGRWRAGHETTVFVFAENAGARIRGAEFDYARTRLFIRPNFLDGLELYGTHGASELRGTFTRTNKLPEYLWRDMTLSLTSTLDLANGAKLLGPTLGARLEPFTFETPPRVMVQAQLDGPGAPSGEHQTMRIETQSTGPFSVYGFPARNLAFDAVLKDSELTLERVEASVADGTLTGNARLWGPENARRLGFDASLRGASLGQTASVVTRYLAERQGRPATAPEKILPGKNTVRLDLALSAEGNFQDPYSYFGNGNAALEGAALGEVRLLGLLSALLEFTALRFTSARGEFKLEGPRVVFPSVSVTGANSAIQAHGDYWLDRRELDFNARVYPFQESNSLLQSLAGAVLAPLSTIMEVKLTGALDDPQWAFVIGPTNLFRSLSQPSPVPTTPTTPAPAPTVPPAPEVKNTEKTH